MHLNNQFFYFIFILLKADACKKFKWNPLNNHLAILILARGGSKGIHLKNIASVGGLPLIRNTLQKIKEVDQIDSIWVSTDHLKIFEEADKENINIHWRSSESATDDASSAYAINEFLTHHFEIDIVGLVQCTSPFIKSKYIKTAVNYINSGAECVFSVTRSHKLFWEKSGDNLIPINFNPSKRPRRQDWNGNLVENGMIYFASRKLLRKGLLQSKQ